jgi:hypothetical protein
MNGQFTLADCGQGHWLFNIENIMLTLKKNYRMNTMKPTTVKAGKEPKERNWAIPDQVVSLEEIQTAIKGAEKGPFMKVQEAMSDFEQWLKSREKR